MAMMSSPFRKRQAQAEADRRRKERETYTVPITIKPGRATEDGDVVFDSEELKDVKEFLKQFYDQIYTKPYKQQLQDLLAKYPNDLAVFHQKLVVDNGVPYEDFWQGYLYRCDVERILKEWERKPQKSRQVRSAALKAKINSNNRSSDKDSDDDDDDDRDNKPSVSKDTFSSTPSLTSSSSSSSSSTSSSDTASKSNHHKKNGPTAARDGNTTHNTNGAPKIINRRADALRGSTSSKGESISERFNRTEAKIGNYNKPKRSMMMGSMQRREQDAAAAASATTTPPKTEKPSSLSQESRNSSTATATTSFGNKLKNLVIGFIILVITFDYSRRLGVGEMVCSSSAVQQLVACLLSDASNVVASMCNGGDSHGIIAVFHPSSNGRGGDGKQFYGGGDGDDGIGSNGKNHNNPLMNSWRKIAERTVNQQMQQQAQSQGKQYLINRDTNSNIGTDDNSRGVAMATMGGSQDENDGIISYFKDKFGRAGVVVEQHVVHHHVHHVIHEHR